MTPDLVQLHDRHLAALAAEGKSPRTIDWYAQSILDFCRFLEHSCGLQAPWSIEQLTTDYVRAYAIDLQTRLSRPAGRIVSPRHRLSDHSANSRIRALKAFASWLAHEGVAPTHSLLAVRPPKTTQHIMDILTDGEIARIADALRGDAPTRTRDRAMFLVLLDTGIRASELLTLQLDRCHLDVGQLVVLGKGSKERVVPIGQRARRGLAEYIERARPAPVVPQEPTVFLGQGGQAAGLPMTRNGLGIIMRRLGRRAAVPRLHAHLLRHTWACRYIQRAGDLHATRILLGHSSLTMTEHYLAAVRAADVVNNSRLSILDELPLNELDD